jgi:DNA-binding NtrC family response regulator
MFADTAPRITCPRGHVRRIPGSHAPPGLLSCAPMSAEDRGTTGARPASLLVVHAGTSARVSLPDDRPFVIGRDPDTDLPLVDGGASRRHAQLARAADGRVWISDLGSRNGTWVEGARLTAPRPLASGEELHIGGVTLVFHVEEPLDARVTDALGVTAPPTRLEMDGRVVLIADPAMRRIYELLQRLARSSLPVLITGETGTGKENAAYAVHHHSPRRAGPFLSLNCAAIAETLVESELFGHERGAFSGAVRAKPGLFEAASGGTLFLDELGELSLGTQAKLLRALETQRILPVGAVQERSIDVRLVAATHRDLPAEVAAGRFRQDLLYRLGAATVQLPPLHMRTREIPVLVAAFLADACRKLGRAPLAMPPLSLQLLIGHRWPGNVRELRNLIEYLAAVVVGDRVEPRDLPDALRRPLLPDAQPASPTLPTTASPPAQQPMRPLADEIRELERTRIVAALAQAGGVQKRAAELLGVPLRTFMDKLKHHGLRRSDKP